MARRGRAALGAALLAAAGPALADPAVIPTPATVAAQPGPGWHPRPGMAVVGDPAAARWLAGELPALRLHSGALHPAIHFVRADGFAAEGYALDIGAGGATITATTPAGLFYGAVTLRQMLAGRPALLPATHIADAPRYPWRGLLLDSVRHIQSVPAILRLIDLMALHKLNTLQWHLTDDQGWRLPIRRYPRLAAVGGWRTTPYGARYGGVYSHAEVRRIVAYAAARHITVVPEIEMPAHALAAIRAMPALGIAGVPASAQSDWGIFPSIFNVDDATFTVLERVLDEVMALFPSHTIAIGGDEAMLDGWRQSPAAQARMQALGLTDPKALQGWFMARIAQYLAAHGRRALGWDDLLLAGGVPGDAAMLSWHSAAGAASALAGGHDVVMATDPVLYLDHRQAADPAEPPGRGTVITADDILRFDPGAPPPGATGRILGVQAQVWTEYMATDAQMLAMTWPRAAALAEVGWSAAPAALTPRWPLEQGLLRAAGVRPTAGAFVAPAPAAQGPLLVSQQLRSCSNRLVLNIAGAPGTHPAAMLVDIMDRCWITPPLALDGARRIAARIAPLPFNYQLAGAETKITLRPPLGPRDELVVRRDSCDGPELARIPLEPGRPGVPVAGAAAIPAQAGAHPLCVFAATRAVAPLWALASIEVSR